MAQATHARHADRRPTPLPSLKTSKDDEATKAKKKRLQKSYKSKQRFAKMDLETKEKANAWKSFVTGKGAGGCRAGSAGMTALGSSCRAGSQSNTQCCPS